MRDDAEVRAEVARVDRMLDAIAGLDDGDARRIALEAVEALVLVYGEGLERIVRMAEGGEGRLVDALADDELVSHLLLLHGLHPLDVEARVQLALEEARPHLRSHGGDVELVAVEGTTARLRLDGSCNGCPSSSAASRQVLEEAVLRRAPDLERVETVAGGSSDANFVPLDAIRGVGPETAR